VAMQRPSVDLPHTRQNTPRLLCRRHYCSAVIYVVQDAAGLQERLRSMADRLRGARLAYVEGSEDWKDYDSAVRVLSAMEVVEHPAPKGRRT
jgi:hypothetical protein